VRESERERKEGDEKERREREERAREERERRRWETTRTLVRTANLADKARARARAMREATCEVRER